MAVARMISAGAERALYVPSKALVVVEDGQRDGSVLKEDRAAQIRRVH